MGMNLRLALGALAAATLVACDSGVDASRAALGRLARVVEEGADHVAAREVAAWRIEGHHDFEVIDVRSRPEYDAGHVEDARHVPLSALVGDAELERLAGRDRVVVYAEDTDRAAQAAVLLRLASIDAYSLDGGYRAWQRMASGADVGAQQGDSPAEREQVALGCYFSGDYDRAAGFARGEGFLPPLAPACPPAAAASPVGEVAAQAPADDPAADDAPAEELELIVEEGC